MAKKKRRPEKKRLPERKLSSKVADQLYEAHSLTRMGRWSDAAAALARLDEKHPQVPEVMIARMEVGYHFQDYRLLQELSERLLPHRPRDPRLYLQLASVCLKNTRPALALRTYRTFLERWPDHVEAPMAREGVAKLEKYFHEQFALMGIANAPDPLQLAVWHEELQADLGNSRYAKCCETADKLLQVQPHFAPALNNSGEAHWRLGNLEQAIACARRVLSFEPDNLHALGNLTRYLTLCGRPVEADEPAQHLRSLNPPTADGWIKIAETFTYLGEDAVVLSAVDAARKLDEPAFGMNLAMLSHFAAVAVYRLGQEDEARRLWQEALDIFPGYETPQGNLEDLRMPIENRHAAWPFEMNYWLSKKLVEDFIQQSQLDRQRKHGDVQAAAQLFLAAHPEFAAVVPILLDRGDEPGRFFALQVAKISRTPAMLEALHQFALSQRGPDQMRLEAAHLVTEAGLLHGPMRFWANGQWGEVLLVHFEIDETPSHDHSPAVAEMVVQSHDLVMEGSGPEAEDILRRALELEPDAPDIKNNLAAALELQKRRSEYEALISEIHAKHPDYWFGRTNMARLEVRAGRLDEAQALLRPLLSARRVHPSELRALAFAEIDLALARGQKQGAEYWLQMMERFLPDDWQLPAMRRLVKRFGVADLISPRTM